MNDKFKSKSTSDLIKIVDDGRLTERARAIFFLGERCKTEERIVPQVAQRIFDSKNKKAKLLGTVTVSFLGVGGLVKANTSSTKKIVDDFTKTLSGGERENLISFLRQFDTNNMNL